MSSSLEIWDPHQWWEFQLAKKLNIPFFENYTLSTEFPTNSKNNRIALIRFESIPTDYTDRHATPTVKDTNLWDYRAVIVYTSELLTNWWPRVYGQVCEQLHNDRTIFIFGGKTCYTNPPDSIFYHKNLHFFAKVTAYNWFWNFEITHKPYLFDALLGTAKPARSWVYCKIQESKLLDRSLVNIQPHFMKVSKSSDDVLVDQVLYKKLGYNTETVFDYQSPELHRLESYPVQQFKNSAKTPYERYSTNCIPIDNHDQYHETIMNDRVEMSCTIPWQVYRHSWYSIVCETSTGSVTFLTEKTAKCLYAKRVFIMFGGEHYLKYLRSFGFKTFHNGIIDESYDEIEDKKLRFEAAWDQVIKLSTLNPLEVYESYQDVLEHNHQLMLELPKKQLLELKHFIHSYL